MEERIKRLEEVVDQTLCMLQELAALTNHYIKSKEFTDEIFDIDDVKIHFEQDGIAISQIEEDGFVVLSPDQMKELIERFQEKYS